MSMTQPKAQRRLEEREDARTAAIRLGMTLRTVAETLPLHARKFFWRQIKKIALERLPKFDTEEKDN